MRDRLKQTKPHDCHCGHKGKNITIETTCDITKMDCPNCPISLVVSYPDFSLEQVITMWNHLQKEMTEVLDG